MPGGFYVGHCHLTFFFAQPPTHSSHYPTSGLDGCRSSGYGRGSQLSITGLGRTLAGDAEIKHKIKRMDRLVGNRQLAAERLAVYTAMVSWLLQSLPLPIVLIDWSPLSADQSQHQLRASLPVGGRALTLYEESHLRHKLGNRSVQEQFLSRLKHVLPAHVTPIIVADSGFRTPFFRAVENLGWHWLGRIRNRDYVAFADASETWLPAKSLYAQATRIAKRLGAVHWVRNHPLDGQLVTFYRRPKGRKHMTTHKRPVRSCYSRKAG